MSGRLIERFELQEEFNAVESGDGYDLSNEDRWSSVDPDALIGAAVEQVAHSSENIRIEEVFEVYCYFLKNAASTSASVMGKLLDSITSGLKVQIEASTRRDQDEDSYASHRLPFELYIYLLHWFCKASESVKVSADDPPPAAKSRRGRGGKAATARMTSRSASNKRTEAYSWEDQVPEVLALITKLLKTVQMNRIWPTTAEKDMFLHCVTRPVYNHICINEQYLKNSAIKAGVFEVFCTAVKHHNQALALQVHITQSLDLYEHLAESMAECLYLLSTKYDHTQTGEEVLREISNKVFAQQDTKGPRNYARFLVRFTELCPRSTLKQLALLINQQDSDAYALRQAVVEILGLLITERDRTLESEAEDEDQKKKIQNEIVAMFDLIFERSKDQSSYVRNKVLQVLATTCDLKAKFPKQRLRMVKRALQLLMDKTATVRKSAIALFIRLLVTHPWIFDNKGMLTRDKWEATYEEARKDLAAVEGLGNVDVQEADDEESQARKKKKKKKRNDDEMEVDEDDEEQTDEEGDTEQEDEMSVDEDGNGEGPSRRRLKPRKSELNVQALSEEAEVLMNLDEKELAKKELRKKYCQEALRFISYIETAMETIEKLLGSKSKPEVLEAIDFFKVAHVFEIHGANRGIRKMLHLIWAKDNSTISEDGKEIKGIRQKLLECYRYLYFDPVEDLEPKAQINRIAKNLIERTYEATLAELTSLEEMMRIMMEEDCIHRDIISKLWQIYTSSMPLPKEQRRGAIIILGMLGVAKPKEVLSDRVEVMLKVGLGKLGKIDLTLARYTCVALQRLNGSAKKVKGSLEDKTIRMPMDNPIFRKLMSTIIYPSRCTDWFGLAEQVINTVYALGEHPDIFCNELIKKLTIRAFAGENNKTGSAATQVNGDGTQEDQEMDEDQQAPAPDQTQDPDAMNTDPPTISTRPSASAAGSKDVGDAFELSQLLFVVGHVAIKHIVFLEIIEREWKRQRDAKQAAEKKAAKADAAGRSAKDKDGDELDQVVGNAEDDIADQIGGVREKELLYGPESLLAVYGPMLVHICGSPHKFKNPTLRAAATLAFSKFLCVSSQFCDQHHKLLFKILETSKDANIRSNIVIALGDVAVAFNHIIDENTTDLYKGLSDRNMTVKKNTLMVLTHLILNGMIKVKGQLGEMAKCLEDEDDRISDLARLFFSELSGKDNAIYNNLPDIISHLSTGQHAVEEDKFHSTMKFIFDFIKDKQSDAIVEKLCGRFQLSESPRQWRDIAYCLSLLPYKSERSVKKLIEGLQFYRDKLHEKGVYDKFMEILNKARQNKSKDKPDAELDEFEKILEEHKAQGEEDQALQNRVNKAKRKRGGATRKGRKKAATAPADDEE
ncbi:condensin [Coprinopsis cinerea AmutBmut pab1-1]|nr:condensin [Coprinopsis cinerea AmutBmut pab1-1]